MKTPLWKRKKNKSSTYWRTKADTEVTKYYTGLPCKICDKTNTCGHHLVRREVAYYRHHPQNIIPLCPLHHKYSNDIAAHSTNLLAQTAFKEWIEENYRAGYKCLQEQGLHEGEKVDYEQAYNEWKELNE